MNNVCINMDEWSESNLKEFFQILKNNTGFRLTLSYDNDIDKSKDNYAVPKGKLISFASFSMFLIKKHFFIFLRYLSTFYRSDFLLFLFLWIFFYFLSSHRPHPLLYLIQV